MTPSWLTDLLAGVMLVVAAYCAGRVVFARLRHRPTEHDIDLLHVLMGVAMAGMLASRLSILNNHIWEALFAAAVVWFAVRTVLALRGADRTDVVHRIPYLLAPAAMLYMYLAPISAAGGSGGGGMAGMADSVGAASRYPIIDLFLIVCMVGFAVLTTDRTMLTSSATPGGLEVPGTQVAAGSHCGPLAPRAANCCHIAMSVTMAYMLIVLL
jgi:Domain of unknown function (DUF5134)